MTNYFKQCQFLISAAHLNQLPDDNGTEVAFVGCSNAGKSSALNAIVGTKQLATVGKTPGRTQMINVFGVSDNQRLIDLPGYGFATVSLDVKLRWQATLIKYLETRDCLQGIVLLMDSRHPLKELDLNFLRWSAAAHLPAHVLLTKSDKLSRQESAKAFKLVEHKLPLYHPSATLQLFSSTHHVGLDQVSKQVLAWLTGCEN